jgi:hypothetical protein
MNRVVQRCPRRGPFIEKVYENRSRGCGLSSSPFPRKRTAFEK